MKQKTLEGRAALVTGAGSGIGTAIARAFHAAGAKLLLNDIEKSGLSPLGREFGLPAERLFVADVSDSAAVGRMFSAVDESSGPLDILVNNAGIAEPEHRWGELNRIGERRAQETRDHGAPVTPWDVTRDLDDSLWQRMLDVHMNGTFFCTREALKRMTPRRSGAIVNLSSTAAISGLADAPHYAAAKAGILGFTKSVARDVASRNIRVNAIAPGYTETPMTANISETLRQASMTSIPLGRWAEASEIAEAAVFLASSDASYMTGQCISPNGGMI